MAWALRILFVLLGAALAVSLASIDIPVVMALLGSGMPVGLAGLLGAVMVAAPPVALGLLPPVRQVEATAAAGLLGVDFPHGIPGPARTWGERGRSLTWFLAHVVCGVAAVALVAGLTALGVRPVLVPAMLGAAVVVAALGWLMGRLAVPLLGPSYAERLHDLEQEAARLSQRNQIARELHDSVGHSLSLITLQASAGRRVVADDPGFAARALADIEEVGRSAAAELDQMLGVLRRDDDSPRAPAPDLTALDSLLVATRASGLRVRVERTGDLASLPAPVSRAAYRILQEGLTNAMRYSADQTAEMSLRHQAGSLRLRVSNPVRRGTVRRGGRGLAGVRERAEALAGSATTSSDGDRWTMSVDLPVRAS